MKHCIAALFLTFVLSLNLSAQSDWHTYPNRSIAEIIDLNPPELSEKADITISAKPFPSKTSVIYMGESRPLSKQTKDFISLWLQTRNLPAENASLLAEEYLFVENGKEYWIPVLTKTASIIKKDLKKGDEIFIYYFFLGGYNPKKLAEKSIDKTIEVKNLTDKIQWIFMVEIFRKSEYKKQPLSEAINKNFNSSDYKTDFFIDSRQVKSKSKVVFTGEVRNASEKKMKFLAHWLEEIEQPLGILQLLRQEALFREGDKDYWLTIRRSILDEMQQSLKKGDVVEIHTILVGAMNQKDLFSWEFIVGEFTR